MQKGEGMMPSNKVELKWEDGLRIAHDFFDTVGIVLDGDSVKIAGSIRRLRPVVHDVDIVFRPNESLRPLELKTAFQGVEQLSIVRWGPKLAAIVRGLAAGKYELAMVGGAKDVILSETKDLDSSLPLRMTN